MTASRFVRPLLVVSAALGVGWLATFVFDDRSPADRTQEDGRPPAAMQPKAQALPLQVEAPPAPSRTPNLSTKSVAVRGPFSAGQAAAIRQAGVVQDAPSAAFYQWAAEYLAAPPEKRKPLEARGVALAQARLPAFRSVIISDPKRALEEAVPMVVRQALPESVTEVLEKRVNNVGTIRVYQGVPEQGQKSDGLPIRKVQFQDGKTYTARVYGRRAQELRWVPGASLNGVAVGSDMAVNERPSRTLEVGEVPAADKPVVSVCPISGEIAPAAELSQGAAVTEQTPMVETATELVQLCGQMHIDPYNQTLLMGEGVTGGATGFTGLLPSAPTPALGTIRVLAIPTTYADQNGVPSTEAALYNVLRDVADFYAKSSFGRLTLVGAVSPPIKLPHNEAWYINRDTSNGGDIDGEGLEHSHAREEARKLGFDSNDYDCIVVRHNGGPGSYGGLGGGSSVWMRSDNSGVWAHEIGHCFGLGHSNFWDTAGTSAIGAGTNSEYGDPYDNMGNSGSFPAGHYNSQAKSQIKWLTPAFVQSISQSGQYRLHAFDQATLVPGQRYAFTIVKDAQRTYWGEVRSLFDTNPWVKNGVLLGWRFPNGSGGNLQRIDCTPGSPFLKEDAPIALGNTFSDREAGIHITTVAVNENPRYADLVVQFGQFPGNQPPSLSLAASSEVVPVGTTVTLTAAASDPDGDPLAYYWQHFGDSAVKLVSGNSPVITRTFSAAGIYAVSCTASDMRGGTTTRTRLITVGNGNGRFTISGRVTLQGRGLQDVVITANGANGVVTDADGDFTIPNLSANTYTLTPLLYGYSFSELFNNSIPVGPSAAGANFEAAPTPVVEITPTGPSAGELAPVTPGKFTLTRSGDNSQPLTVNVNAPLGTATKTTDYTLVPDTVTASQGFNSFTIPAGASALEVLVTPVVDTAQEGPETVILQLGPGNGYLVGPQSAATVVIQDDDSALPKVSLALARETTVENSGSPAQITFSRTGPTSAALSVTYSVSGTATAGTDYEPLSGTLLIPAGTSSAILPIQPVNDQTSEPLETVKISIATGASFLAEPAASSVSASLIDDDLQVVSVVASDPAATEVDLSAPGAVADTGTFVVTRTGDITLPLTVFYAVYGPPSPGIAALHGTDYEALPGSVVIPAGATQASITILPRYDTLGEGPESVVLSLGSGSTNYILGSSISATVTIADAPGTLPSVDVIPLSSGSEPATNGTFRITVRGGTGTGSLPVAFTLGGTALLTTDYTVTGTGNSATGTTVTLNNGATVTKDIVITPVNDTEAEELESVTLTLTPSAAYTSFAPTTFASLWMRDDERPTVYVDAQVGTSGSSTATEGTAASPLKFYVARTGSTASALTVQYTTSGTATAGTDYTALSGSVTIPAGSPGADIPVAITNDTLVEGTETISLDLAPGAYSRGPSAVLLIADDESNPQTVGFLASGDSGPESVGTLSIPVSLATPATTPVTVDYFVDSGTRAATSTSGALLPYWLRINRVSNSFTVQHSADGVTWTTLGSAQTVAMSSTSYLAGIAVSSKIAGSLSTATFDNVAVTGLSAGGTTGASTSADIGTPGAAGSSSVTSGVYTVTGAGADIGGTADAFHYLWFPITNSANCTLTARILTHDNSNSGARAAVMFRETSAANARHVTAAVTPANSAQLLVRSTAGSNGTNPTNLTLTSRPAWLRIQRTGNLFTADVSRDGLSWAPIGKPQSLPFPPNLLAGLAVSAQSDGLIATAAFEQLSISSQPNPTLEGRTIGFVNEEGSVSFTAPTYTVTGSGAGINSSSQDECHFAATPVSGDFQIVAKLTSLSGGASGARAGLMLREDSGYRGRMLYVGVTANSGPELIVRDSSNSTAQGSGIDFLLPAGTLTFQPGEQTQPITLQILNDNALEPLDNLVVVLRNPSGAALGTFKQFTYSIVDDDSAASTAFVSFASTGSTFQETDPAASVLVTLSRPMSSTVTVDFATADGSATAGADYTAVSGSLSFAPGETVKAIQIPVLQDLLTESTETVAVSLSNPVGVQLGTLNAHSLQIKDDEFPTLTVTATDPDASESGDPGAFTLVRTGSIAQALTVSFALSGTASFSTDYSSIPPLVTIPAGEPSVTVTLSPIQDSNNEGTESVTLTVTANAAYQIGSPNSATVRIADDDRSTVQISAPVATASETPGQTGQFLVTRSEPTTASLTVSLAVSGTATSGTDYTSSPATFTSLTFAAGESAKTVSIQPVDDLLTEPTEFVLASLNTGAYDIGANAFASIQIIDNDLPPTLFITSPAAAGFRLPEGQGAILRASVTDDGLPQPLSFTWSQVAGPGTAQIESPSQTETAVTFSAPGTYILQLSATDGQFTVSDQVSLVYGSAIAPADWITQDLGPSSSRRGQTLQLGSTFTLAGTGAGYTASADAAHVDLRSVDGDSSVTARLTSAPATASFAGLTLRDALPRGARRAVLGFVPGTGLQFRTRATVSTVDTVTTQAGVTLPLWLKLERNATTQTVTASYASDVAGVPGPWQTLGTPAATSMDNRALGGLTVTSNSASSTATAVFDSVTVSPDTLSPTFVSEDANTTPSLAGSASLSNGVYTVAGGPNGYFHGWQYSGDLMVTAKHASATSGAGSAISGIRISENIETGAYAQMGRIPTGSYSGFLWRSIAGGNGGGVPTFTGAVRWIRIIRRGNSITAFHAPDVSGAPGVWAQVGQPQTVIMTTPVLVGFYVDNATGVGLNTVTFSNLSIVPLNTAPVISFTTPVPNALSPVALQASVVDDSLPVPARVTTAWNLVSGPGPAFFSAPIALHSSFRVGAAGSYTLRLSADDGGLPTFRTLDVSATLSPYDAWAAAYWPLSGFASSSFSDPLADPDGDGFSNLAEFALNSQPNSGNGDPVSFEEVEVDGLGYLRISIPRNPAATGLSFQLEAKDQIDSASGWTPVSAVVEHDSPSLLQLRDTVPVDYRNSRFLRVRISNP